MQKGAIVERILSRWGKKELRDFIASDLVRAKINIKEVPVYSGFSLHTFKALF